MGRINLEDSIAGAFSLMLFEVFKNNESLSPEVVSKSFSKHFYNEWFQKLGNSYLIVFRKNLEETNIQMTELLSLIRLSTDEGKKFHSISSKDFKKTIENIWVDVHAHVVKDIIQDFIELDEINKVLSNQITSDIPEEVKETLKLIIKQSGLVTPLVVSYFSLLSRTIVIDAYHGTAALHVPPTINIKLDILCGLSGYIHSCGNLILSRDIKKTKIETVEGALKNYINQADLKKDERVAFCIYANDEKTQPREDNFGLSSLRLQIDKYYIEQKPLNSEVTRIFNDKSKGSIGSKLKWIDSYGLSAFQTKPLTYFTDEGVKQDRIVWLFVEHGLDKSGNKRKNKKYYVFYEQLYRNTSTYYLYDEDKPAWKAPETIPPSLDAAMLNISMASRGLSTETTVNDPFCGSGTTLLESLKYKKVECISCDQSPESKQIMHDNIRFFSSSTDEIANLSQGITSVLSETEGEIRIDIIDYFAGDMYPNPNMAWSLFINLINRLHKTKDELNIDEECRIALNENNENEIDLEVMVLFYILYKAAYKTIKKERFTLPEIIKSDYFSTIVTKQIHSFEETVKKHLSLLRFNKIDENGKPNSFIIPNTHLGKKVGRFATWVYPCKSFLHDFYHNKLEIQKKIKTASIEDELIVADIYIADPPYGVNVEKDLIILQNMYSKMIENLVTNLTSANRKNEIGHIAICVPSETYTGLRSAFFTDPQLLINQIIANVDEAGGEVLNSAEVLPAPTHIFNLPCYWRAPKTLDRAVLFFKIAPKTLS